MTWILIKKPLSQNANNRQHAYVYEGSRSLLNALGTDACLRFGFPDPHDPDVHIEGFEKFGVDESRDLRALASLKSAAGKSLFILYIASATSEAQQALLKLCEEPPLGMIIVLLMPHGMLFATLRSRFMTYPAILTGEENTYLPQATTFLKATYKKRSEIIAELLEDEEETREKVRAFVSALEEVLYPYMSKGKTARTGLSELGVARSYLYDRAPSYKMLLEHIAVSLPVIT